LAHRYFIAGETVCHEPASEYGHLSTFMRLPFFGVSGYVFYIMPKSKTTSKQQIKKSI
jgi:hypothetical protein